MVTEEQVGAAYAVIKKWLFHPAIESDLLRSIVREALEAASSTASQVTGERTPIPPPS